MRIFISLLLVSAVATSLLAYGPFLNEGSAPDDAIVVAAEGPEATLSGAGAAAPVQADASALAPVAAAASDGAPPAAAPVVLAAPEVAPGAPVVAAVAVAPGKPAPVAKGGLLTVDGRIRGSLHATLAAELGRETAEPLAQVVTRLLVWWMNLRKDARPGDAFSVVYELRASEEPRVHALSYTSAKHGRTFRTFLYQAEGERYPRYYTEDGRELEERLVDSPIATYEQITSLLRDGRRHQGVDFKAPTGTEVVAPFDAVVQRRNWSTRRNGNCLHLRRADGTDVLFLHLDRMPADVKPGTRVQKGQLVAWSGNTGRSTAAHLHYQLQTSSGRILDPMEVHETYRKALPEAELRGFRAEVSRLSSLLEAAGADT